jgi:hypothetical protein
VSVRISRILPAVFLLSPTFVVSANDSPVPEPNQATATQMQIQEPRFEGYLFLDTEGRPLPIQTDAEIEAFLAEAEIVDRQQIPVGITNPLKLTLKADGIEANAAFNDADIGRRKVTEIINGRSYFSLDWRDSFRYSIAAYRLDRLLGLDRVPPVVQRELTRDPGAISIWLANSVTETERQRNLHVDPPDTRRWNQQRLLLQVFDDLVANRDSNLSNLLIDANWRLWFIDCSRCFGETKTLYYPLQHISQCERSMWEGLKSLTESEVKERLAPLLSKAEIKALMVRHDKIVRHFQRLIDERSEAAVIYDVAPPSARAPWGGD